MRRKLLSAVLFLAILLTSVFPGGVLTAEEPAPTGLVDDFDDNTLTGWWGSANYVLTEENGELRIDSNKQNNSWASFGMNFEALDISSHPYVSVKVKSEVDFMLNLSLFDENGSYAYPGDNAVGTSYEIVASNYYSVYTFDFSGVGAKVDLTKIVTLNIVFNPGTPGARGTVYFDEVRIGDGALVVPDLVAVPEQQTHINAGEQRVLLRGIHDGTDGTHPVTITASSSNPELIPHPLVDYSGGSTGYLRYTPVPGMTGTATITVNVSAEGTNADKVVMFDVIVEKNMPPKMNPVEDQVVKSGTTSTIRLTGIDDGNPNARQSISITAVSSAPELVPHPQVEYSSDDRWGELTFTTAPEGTGVATITLTLEDDGGVEAGGEDTASFSFDVYVYREINKPPVIDMVRDVSVFENSGEHTVLLTGIGDGDEDYQQNISITAESSNPELIPDPTVIYSQGSSTAELKFTPAADTVGKSIITLTLTDDGGTPDNNGDATTVVSFEISVRVRPITGFEDDFEDGVIDPAWLNTGEGCHFCFEEKDGELGVLRIEVDKYITNNKWAGLWYSIPTELDLSENPYISIRMKTSTPGTDMLIFLWDAFDHYNTARTVTHTVTGEYVEYYFDFTDKLLQGDGTPLDPSRIKALLINFAPGVMYQGTFYFDDLRVGDKAHRPAITPDVTIDPLPDYALPVNAGEQEIELTGISNGAGDMSSVVLTAQSSNADLIPGLEIGAVSDGKALLKFTPAADATGTALITVRGEAEGSNAKEIRFRVDVLNDDPASAVEVRVDRSTRYQEIDGFGAFLGTGQLTNTQKDIYLRGVNDIGMSMARFGVINDLFEYRNDNSNPYITDYDALDYDTVPMDFMEILKEKSNIDKYILSFWSPSAWMKRNKWQTADSWAQDNKLEPHYYEEYAEQIVAIIKAIKERTGIDLYAVSPQNEPEFNEPYPSCVILWDEYKEFIKVLGRRFRQEGITTKIFMPEGLWAQNHIDEYINTIVNDPEAAQYVEVVAVHNYDRDGINVGGPSAMQWRQTYQLAQQLPFGKKAWMTETSGHANNWNGAITLAANIYTSLYYGNASAWVWWSFNDTPNSAQYGLMVNGEPTSRYAVSKHYYKFIQPGATRVKAVSQDGDILCLAFDDPVKHRTSIVLINRGSTSHAVNITGEAMPSSYQLYVTSNNRMFERQADVSDGVVLLPPSSIATLYSEEVLPEPPPPVAGRGSILREYWVNIGGNKVSDLTSNPAFPDYPTGISEETSFEAPADWGDNYGQRMRGYLYPDISGEYTFWICSDDASELWLSTDEDPDNKVKIAWQDSWAPQGQWEKEANQKSQPIFLEGGKKYYIEALHKEANGGDHLAVAWKVGQGAQEIIPGEYLSPYYGDLPEDTEPPTAPENLRVVSVTPNSVTLEWDPSSDNVAVTQYEVFRDSQPAGTTVDTVFTVTGLTPGTQYIFTVKAKDSVGNTSPESNAVTVTTMEEPDEDVLAFDNFDYPVSPLDGVNSGYGWAAGWHVQSNITTQPGYGISDENPLSYGDLKVSGNYAVGGRDYLTAGRLLDISADGPFGDYLKDVSPGGDGSQMLIGADGKTLWISALLRKETSDNERLAITLHPSHIAWYAESPVVAAGYFGEESNSEGQRYWTLRIGSDVHHLTQVPVQTGETVLLVLKLEFGSPSWVSLYVNPEQLGGEEPDNPDITAEIESSAAFRGLTFYGGNGPGKGSVDEIRFGRTYASVTPVEEVQPEVPSTSITGSDSVEAGQEITFDIGLTGTAGVYAHDITLSYDPDLLEFVKVEPAIDDVLIAGFDAGQAGVVRVLSVNINALAEGTQLLKVTFKAKSVSQAVNATVSITEADLGLAPQGGVAAALTSEKTIAINVPIYIPEGDINRDGTVNIVDVALVAYYYGVDSSSPDWDRAKAADVNGDNVVDIADLAFVANKVLSR